MCVITVFQGYFFPPNVYKTHTCADARQYRATDRNDIIVKEIRKLEDAFENLKLVTLQSLQNSETEDENFLKTFQHRLILLSGSIKEGHSNFFSKKNRASIRRAKSVQVIFDLLSQYMSFLNSSLLFYVIDKFADPATKKEILLPTEIL